MLFSQRAGGFRGALPERNFKKIGAGKICGVVGSTSLGFTLNPKPSYLFHFQRQTEYVINANMDERDVGI